MDIEKHIEYWISGAREDLEVELRAIQDGKIRHALFFAHLTLEKALKAEVCRRTNDVAPRIHNLVRLSQIAELQLEDSMIDFLADMNQYNIEGRYPEFPRAAPDLDEARALFDSMQGDAVMADQAVIESVRNYLAKLCEAGLESPFAMLFGSYATGRADAWSDIDVVVVSTRFDSMTSRDWVNILWRVAARTDARIEPIACGVKQWEEDEGTPILEIARREGIRIES